jgi:hypothetical protein
MGNEYDAAIAALETQIAELQMAAAVLRKQAGQSPSGGGPSGIHSGTFLNKTIPEAARMYLEMCNKRPQKPEAIAEALQRGGMTSKAKNFVAMLQTILRRTEAATGEFMRTPAQEWALPEWFDKKPMPKAAAGENGKSEATKPQTEEAGKAAS